MSDCVIILRLWDEFRVPPFVLAEVGELIKASHPQGELGDAAGKKRE